MSSYRLRDRGSIFIVALWALFILGALAAAVNSYIWPQLRLARKVSERAKLHYLAKAALKRAILEISQDRIDSYDALKDSWSNNEEAFKDIRLADERFSISYSVSDDAEASTPDAEEAIRYGLIDEERKININMAPLSTLKNFFEVVGKTSLQEASDIAASIVDWRDADEIPQLNGAESGYYLTLKPGYPSKNGNFQILEELLLVKGMTREIFDAVREKATIYGIGAVNINTADILVLRSLGISPDLAEKVIDFRKGADGKEATADDNVFDNVSMIAETLTKSGSLSAEELAELKNILSTGAISVRSDNFMGRLTANIDGQNKRTGATFIFNRNKAIRYWRED